VYELSSVGRVIDSAGEKSIVSTAEYGLTNYTSDSGMIAPRLSTQLHAAIRNTDLEKALRLSALFSF